MLRAMYGASRLRSLGSTMKRCMIHGYARPKIRLDTMSSAVPTNGMRQRPVNAVTKKSNATSAAMAEMICRAGIVALTAVYEAPVSKPEALNTVAYWSSQMLTACSAK
ncbi:unannotated protein [freshwater metagenome]|uniref:Unannotated protein n=1 Tax=freshwater metagenome TaxID=449393 RepID=A0A6J6DRY5_9ZZZZ